RSHRQRRIQRGKIDMSRHLAKALGLVVGVGLMAACASGSNTNSGQKFSGVTVRVVTFTGPQIAEPLQRRAPDFEKATGAKVQIITVPFSDLYQKVLTDFATKTNSYDATVFDPQWMGDYVPPGYLEDLTDRVKNDSTLQWDDIAPFFRDFSATFKGKVYTIPLDGDFQMVYYRKDLLQKDGLKAPETWQDYIHIARHFQGKDLNGDGKTQSKVEDKVGAVILPGSKQVLDRSTGQLADCNATLCPYAVNGVNHAPFAAFGGWSGAINKASSAKVKDAAFAFLSYMSAPK